MGFIQQICYVVGGSEEFPTGTTYSDRLFRSKTLITKIANALIACNVGWQLDTSKNLSVTDYTDIPDVSGSYPFPGLFLINSISNCKLFISYFGEDARYYGIKDFSGNDVIPISGYKYHCGLCMSMIPDGSSNTFGDSTTNTFIPSDATRISGTWYANSNSFSSPKFCAAYNPSSGVRYTYIILATPYVVSVFTTHNDSGSMSSLAMPTYACGRIFGEISHSETTTNAKYGTVNFRYAMNNEHEGWVYVFSSLNNGRAFGVTTNFPWYSTDFTDNPLTSTGQTCGAISREDGTWINGKSTKNGYNYNVALYTVDPSQLDRTYTFLNSNTEIRWSAIGMMSVGTQDNISDVAIKDNNCFKGYLDTELFRACNGSLSRGITFDNGKFIIPEDSVGWLFGWDPSNGSIL